MKNLTHGLILVAAAALTWGCADLGDPLPAAKSGGVAVHPEGWTDPPSAEFHGRVIRSAGWDMQSCRTCHGADYSGGVTEVSCQTCHAVNAGPENCSTCHGSAGSPAPPEDIDGNTTTAAPGVGAHQRHLNGGTLSSRVWCYDCHKVPPAVYTAGHVDSDLPAEVPMAGALARTQSAGVIPEPVYDYESLTCGNTYCHGNWNLDSATSAYPFIYVAGSMSGKNSTPLWTGGSGETTCGSCHGLPPAGHRFFEMTECANCHIGVVDREGKIADRSLHMNGRINFLGLEYDF